MDQERWQGLLMMLMYTLTTSREDPMNQLDFCVNSLEQTEIPLETYLDAVRRSRGPMEQHSEAALREFLRSSVPLSARSPRS